MFSTMMLLAPGAVARRLNLSTSRVIQLDREGVLPALRDSSGRRLYDAEAVEIFARERETRRSVSASSAHALNLSPTRSSHSNHIVSDGAGAVLMTPYTR